MRHRGWISRLIRQGWAVLMLFGCALSLSHGADTAGRSAPNGFEVHGLLIDRTITQLGHEFYRHFAAAWSVRHDGLGYNLVVSETPSAAWGSRIVIQQDGETLFSAFVRPGRLDVEELALSATQTVYERLAVRIDRLRRQRDPDLAVSGY